MTYKKVNAGASDQIGRPFYPMGELAAISIYKQRHGLKQICIRIGRAAAEVAGIETGQRYVISVDERDGIINGIELCRTESGGVIVRSRGPRMYLSLATSYVGPSMPGPSRYAVPLLDTGERPGHLIRFTTGSAKG
ncbi:MAG: hypothetical protein COW29_01330 [Rhodobacterales bacterium CG15_BIG_FIL_POST_REV_8_21_14_020_59_13]|nr:MAG: hypothetical protein COW29_01330 [Rhodobacterales bacterium CG15_BIG_FIL_POST_REV_8_21_14_020_59_13]